MNNPTTSGPHTDQTECSRWPEILELLKSEESLDEAEKERLYAHLVECDKCLEEVAFILRYLDEPPPDEKAQIDDYFNGKDDDDEAAADMIVQAYRALNPGWWDRLMIWIRQVTFSARKASPMQVFTRRLAPALLVVYCSILGPAFVIPLIQNYRAHNALVDDPRLYIARDVAARPSGGYLLAPISEMSSNEAPQKTLSTAEAHLNSSLEYDPDNISALRMLAQIRLFDGQPEVADNILKGITGATGNDAALILNDRAVIAIGRERLDDAMAFLDQAVKLAPAMAEIYYNRAIVFQEQENFEAAVGQLETSYDLEKNVVWKRAIRARIEEIKQFE